MAGRRRIIRMPQHAIGPFNHNGWTKSYRCKLCKRTFGNERSFLAHVTINGDCLDTATLVRSGVLYDMRHKSFICATHCAYRVPKHLYRLIELETSETPAEGTGVAQDSEVES
jgi:Zinc-finger double-stranded RNA-binding